jgi:predicted  nucleic acid-binding Zn-ribbon protein
MTAVLPKVIGRPDSLTDAVKHLLFQYEPRSVQELLPEVRKHLSLKHPPHRLEKDLLRCLEKNPAFEEAQSGLWGLNLKGLRENDAAYQVLKKEGRPLRLAEINERLTRHGREPIREEKQLVRDGRFLRLKGGAWMLVPWELIRAVYPKEVEEIAQFLRQSREPASLERLSLDLLGVNWRQTNLLQCLEQDPRFIWVGQDRWYLRALVPSPSSADEDDPLEFLREGEKSALQGAELMLTFQDTDPNRRTCVLSSRDLRRGVIRLNKRMERLFSDLPGVAFLKFRTPSGPCPAWFFRDAQVITGLETWFSNHGFVPGSKLEIRRVQEEGETVFHLLPTEDREPEVYTEAKRVEQIAALRDREDLATWPLEELLVEILKIFSEGLAEDLLRKIVQLLRPEAANEMLGALAAFPFFEEISPGTWYFNQNMKDAYDHLQAQVKEARELLEQQRLEAAATLEQVRVLTLAKDDLEAELEEWHRRAAETEERLKEALERCRELERERESLRAEMEKLVRRKEQLRAELSQAEEEIASLQAEKEALENRVEQLENRILQLQGSYNKSLSKAQAEQMALKQKLADTEKRLYGALAANQELQKLLAQLQEERLELKRQLAPWPVRLAVAVSRMLGIGRTAVVDF